jgi:hypothetical protein
MTSRPTVMFTPLSKASIFKGIIAVLFPKGMMGHQKRIYGKNLKNGTNPWYSSWMYTKDICSHKMLYFPHETNLIQSMHTLISLLTSNIKYVTYSVYEIQGLGS